MSDFVSADIGMIEKFASKSQEAITEFGRIKKDFEDVNSRLLSVWKGLGANAYKYETDHIMENVGGIKDVLDSINDGVLNDIKENYNKLDAQLGEFNKNPQSEES